MVQLELNIRLRRGILRFWHAASSRGDTIAVVAKYKLAKGKAKTAPRPQGALPCVVVIILAIFLVMFILYYAMKNANG